jgi:hypothetical protein
VSSRLETISENGKGKSRMSSNDSDDLKSELERLRAENERLKKGSIKGGQKIAAGHGGIK